GNGFNGASGFGGATGFEEVFEEFFNNFGGARSASRGPGGPRPGADLSVDMTITFEESIFGVEKEIEIDRLDICEVCDGNRAEPGTATVTCPQCNGTGEVRQVQQTFLGSMVRVAPCPRCNGRGETIETP